MIFYITQYSTSAFEISKEIAEVLMTKTFEEIARNETNTNYKYKFLCFLKSQLIIINLRVKKVHATTRLYAHGYAIGYQFMTDLILNGVIKENCVVMLPSVLR